VDLDFKQFSIPFAKVAFNKFSGALSMLKKTFFVNYQTGKSPALLQLIFYEAKRDKLYISTVYKATAVHGNGFFISI
jgi:hypothetical protein